MNLLLPNYYILLIFVSSILHTILDKGKFRSTKDGSYIFFCVDIFAGYRAFSLPSLVMWVLLEESKPKNVLIRPLHILK